MKKLILPLIMIFLAASCSDDIETNNPAIQAETQNGFYHTLDVVAEQTDSAVTIQGESSAGTLTLTMSSLSEGEYDLGPDENNAATFKVHDSIYSTQMENADGKIIIDDLEEGITGTFYFNAHNAAAPERVVSMDKGAFFYIPLGGIDDGDDEEPIDCDEAEENTVNAAEDYEAALEAGDEEEIDEACQVYGQALQQEIESCGDEEGELQEILDGLDCYDGEEEDPVDCNEAEENTESAAEEYLGALEAGDEEEIDEACQTYSQALEEQIESCGDEEGELQEALDELDCYDGEDEDPIDCSEAEENTESAAEDYLTALEAGDEEEIEQTCQAYSQVLEEQIEVCGDEEGELQETLDGLDCEGEGDDNDELSCDDAEGEADVAAMEYSDAVNGGDQDEIDQACANYVEALEAQIEACGDDDAEIQDILDELDCD